MYHFRSSAKVYDEDGRDLGPGDWLGVIRSANAVAFSRGVPMPFGSPDETGPWWAGGEVEEYPTARVIHRDDGSVSVVAKTTGTSRLLEAAVELLGL